MTQLYRESKPGPLSQDCVALFGIPFDKAVSYRAGAIDGPAAIRTACECIESYSPRLDRDLVDMALIDIGDLQVSGETESEKALTRKAITERTREILEAGGRPLMLGGDHSVTSPVVRAMVERYPDLIVVQLDAHADLRETFCGDTHNHACAMRRCLDVLQEGHLYQVGIRSGTREEYQEMRAANRLLPPIAEAVRTALLPHVGSPIYVTVDIDVLDPSLMTGTGTVEPGGMVWGEFEKIIDIFAEHSIVGADLVEFAPSLDPTGTSNVVACIMVRELALVMGFPPKSAVAA